MRSFIFALLVFVTLEGPVMAADTMTPEKAAKRITETELAFAKMASDTTMALAFLEYLHDDAVVFRPEPINGKKWYVSRLGSTAELKWWPTYVVASTAGDLGLSTGPYEFQIDKSDTVPVYHGHFVSIWKQLAGGEYRVMADLGISHERPEVSQTALEIGKPRKFDGGKAAKAKLDFSLAQAESSFSALTNLEGTLAGYASYLADDARVYRDGAAPIVEAKAALSGYADAGEQMVSKTTFSDVSAGNDFGYTYGISHNRQKVEAGANEKSFSYLRVWRRDEAGDWRILLDIALPIEK